ncbi:hypothetical protein [Nocardioides donggukensis]|uniref:Uncharacterized protein n=1 Tax=Nocardioides donggukensis TaxID=2774019 RepID=A0A927K3U4_9ACTN|nr:hypothetical protein [Nocardioides donggukensis]MBD8870132.1 hypothetical protein [Nocardioides donggukensis]
MTPRTPTRRFDFRFAPAYRPPALALGITPRTAWVDLDEVELRVRFGLWSMRVPLAHVVGTSLSGGYAFLKTAGPPHLSFTDHGVTFATNGEAGVCVRFSEPVRVLDPTGRLGHPGATLTVREPAELAAALEELRPAP